LESSIKSKFKEYEDTFPEKDIPIWDSMSSIELNDEVNRYYKIYNKWIDCFPQQVKLNEVLYKRYSTILLYSRNRKLTKLKND